MEKKTCRNCRYLKVWHERHPYGSTYALEEMSECMHDEITDEIEDAVWYGEDVECPLWEKIEEDYDG